MGARTKIVTILLAELIGPPLGAYLAGPVGALIGAVPGAAVAAWLAVQSDREIAALKRTKSAHLQRIEDEDRRRRDLSAEISTGRRGG